MVYMMKFAIKKLQSTYQRKKLLVLYLKQYGIILIGIKNFYTSDRDVMTLKQIGRTDNLCLDILLSSYK